MSFWVYFKPESVHYGDLGLNFGHFGGLGPFQGGGPGPILSLITGPFG